MPLPVPISPVRGEVTPATPGGLTANPKSGEGSLGEQDFRDQLYIDQTWTNLGAEGWAHVAVIDSGIDPGHEDLRSTTTNTPPTLIPGGNWLSAMSFDLGTSVTDPNNPGPAPDWPDANVDEAEPVPAKPGAPCATQLTDGSWALVTQNVGHGTHISGVVAANSVNGFGVKGTCKHCGVQVLKGSHLICNIGVQSSVVTHSATVEGFAGA
jgi:subtilisin family serine protease